MIEKSGVTPVFGPVPDGVEVCRRIGSNKQVFILINHTQEQRHVNLPRPMKVLLQGGEGSALDVPAYGVAVLEDNQ